MSSQINSIIKRYLKWYSVPFIYFLLTSLVCAYAWYTRPIPYRAGIKAVFRTISLLPTLILTGTITAWIILALITLWWGKRSSNASVRMETEQSSKATRISFWGKTLNVAISVLGIILIVAGLSVAGWIAKPYITFLFSSSKIEALEKKAELLGQTQGDALQKSEDTKGVVIVPLEDMKKQSGILDKSGENDEQVQGNIIQNNGPEDVRAAIPERVQKVAINKSEFVEKFVKQRQREITRKVDAMKKTAARVSQAKENRIIIPTALVDAPILEGIDMEKLSEGVCHIQRSAVPGRGGNCIIEGHNLGEFGWWRPQGPFNMLEILEEGVLIYVFYNGKKYVYKVKEKIYTDVNNPKLYDFSPGERLTLITCTSTLDITVYTEKRTVIIAYPM